MNLTLRFGCVDKMYFLALFFVIFRTQDRLVANEFLQCRKVCEHVLDKILGSESGVNTMISNNSQSNQNDNSSEGSQVPPEDKIELYCNNTVGFTVKPFTLKKKTYYNFISTLYQLF